MLAHCRLSDFIHKNYSGLQIGGMLAHTEVYPATTSPADNLAVRRLEEFLTYNLCDVYAWGHYSKAVISFADRHKLEFDWQEGDAEILAGGISDFIAFSYYRSVLLDASQITEDDAPNLYPELGMKLDESLPANEWGWTIDPDGFRNIISRLSSRYGLPVFPIENGLGQRESWDGLHPIEDELRISYHRDHIQALKDAVQFDAAEVLGYLGWGLIDIPSSHADMEKRYGAVYVNRGNHDLRDLKRVKKKSFAWFKQAFESNGEAL